MSAASEGADETVAFLLSKGASPDLMDISNQTALVMAIQYLTTLKDNGIIVSYVLKV